MQLEVIYNASTIEGVKQSIELHFEQPMRVIPEKLSMFEQYQVRPTRVFISEAWKYRIVRRDGVYYFGKIKSEAQE